MSTSRRRIRLGAFTWVIVFGVVATAGADSRATSPDAKGVLLLHQSGGPDIFRGRFNVAFVEAIRSGNSGSIELYEEAIETERFPGPKQLQLTRDYLQQKYAGRHISVIVAQGVATLEFARENRALFGNPPIVTIVSPSGLVSPSDDITGLQGGFWITGIVDLARALLPETRHVFVIDGARDNSSPFLAEIDKQLKGRSDVDVTYFRDLPLDDLLSRVSALPEHSIVMFVRQTMRTRSQDIDPAEAIARISEVSAAPVFSHIEDDLGRGVVGGYVWRYEADARRLAEMAQQIANGARVADITPGRATYATNLDWRQLQRWQIPQSRWPAGANVLFRQYSFFEQYWRYLAVCLALFAMQGAIIATLWVQRARRRETEAQNMAILRAAPDVMFLQDREGTYLDYHAPSRDCLFAPPEKFIGYKMRDILPPHVLAHVNPLFERALHTRETVIGEYELEVNGSLLRFEARLVQCGDNRVLSVVRNVTDRTRVQAALVQSERRYALATTAGRSGVWEWNLDTNEVYVDPRFKAMLGFEDHEIPNRLDEWRRHVHPDDLEMVLVRVRSLVEGSSPAFEAEFRVVHRDGSTRWVMARGSVVRDAARPVSVMGTYTDFSDRKQADQALHKAQSELDRMSRLAAFGEFAASIAHEVSQPLTTIIINARACLRWLDQGAGNTAAVQDTLLDVIEAGKRADKIIRRNRELFRRHIVERRQFNLNDVAREVVGLQSDRFRTHSVRLETQLAADLPDVVGDRVALCQLVANLVTNAVEAMADSDPRSRVVVVTTQVTGQGQVQASVSDAGLGLGTVDVSRMFETGYTTKASGTGVGLSICRTIVEAHGGRIWAEGNDDGGATFSFTMPVSVASSHDEPVSDGEIASVATQIHNADRDEIAGASA
ncbi:MAG TPA: ABC transporter substrate binding protein [Vicinamibacterales bacterium]